MTRLTQEQIYEMIKTLEAIPYDRPATITLSDIEIRDERVPEGMVYPVTYKATFRFEFDFSPWRWPWQRKFWLQFSAFRYWLRQGHIDLALGALPSPCQLFYQHTHYNGRCSLR